MSSWKASYSQEFVHEGVDLGPIEHAAYMFNGIRDQWTKSLLAMSGTKNVIVNGATFVGNGKIFVREAYITQSSVQVLVDYSWKSGSTFGIGGARHRLIKYKMDWYVAVESTGDGLDASIEEPVFVPPPTDSSSGGGGISSLHPELTEVAPSTLRTHLNPATETERKFLK